MSKSKVTGTLNENMLVHKFQESGLKASRQPMSGMLKDFPSDIVVEKDLVEAKLRTYSTDAKGQRYIRVDRDWLAKVERNAKDNGFKHGVLIVRGKNSPEPVVLIGWETYLEWLHQQKSTTG